MSTDTITFTELLERPAGTIATAPNADGDAFLTVIVEYDGGRKLATSRSDEPRPSWDHYLELCEDTEGTTVPAIRAIHPDRRVLVPSLTNVFNRPAPTTDEEDEAQEAEWDAVSAQAEAALDAASAGTLVLPDATFESQEHLWMRTGDGWVSAGCSATPIESLRVVLDGTAGPGAWYDRDIVEAIGTAAFTVIDFPQAGGDR
ncbi:hypothetical protein ACRQ4C_05745 [Curtobacterium sp. SP.BCp]|uniref:hypothetical protein n=1 Tax=Curtobacterium sp. SP.BCp TaxID=3435230 RepID=UPI003F735E58